MSLLARHAFQQSDFTTKSKTKSTIHMMNPRKELLHSKGQLENHFFRNLLPEEDHTEEYFHECLSCPLTNKSIDKRLLFLGHILVRTTWHRMMYKQTEEEKVFRGKESNETRVNRYPFHSIQDADEMPILHYKNATI